MGFIVFSEKRKKLLRNKNFSSSCVMDPIKSGGFLSILLRFLFGLCFVFVLIWPVNGLRPLRQRSISLGEEWLSLGKEDIKLDPFLAWNITGTYRGNWKFAEPTISSSNLSGFNKSNGDYILELISTPTKITGVHYVEGIFIFHDVLDNGKDVRGAQIKLEGVYLWPFKQLRMVAHSGKGTEFGQEDDYLLSIPYHLIEAFSSQLFMESPQDKIRKKKLSALVHEMEKRCNIEIAAQVSRTSSIEDGGDSDKYYLEGLMERHSVVDDAHCFSPMLLNASSVDTDIYYYKAINYSLMITFIAFLEMLLLTRQMEHSCTQYAAAKVSFLMMAHQAIMDVYICLLLGTAGYLVDPLFNAFATATFFKFIVFSMFEMRYLHIIWKANKPLDVEDWDITRRELSTLYGRFYAILLGGVLIMYEFHKFFPSILILLHSFWIPQICLNVARDSRKPLLLRYILGITLTRMAIPLYVFGCPHNFMRLEPDWNWCMRFSLFVGLQVFVLLVQHYFGAWCLIPRQFLPDKYSYYRRFRRGSNQAIDCVICMNTIEHGQLWNDCMVTPCDHCFHSSCLQRWMDIKMECPTCRRSLPPD